MPLWFSAMPSFFSPSVGATVPSASMIPSLRNPPGCFFHSRTRIRLTASMSAITSSAEKRRRKSPAVVGSGMRAAPSESM